jgi:abhydrolase domain-containing protein 13
VHIHAWFLHGTGPTAPTIVFFHGNAGNIGLRLPNALQMLQYVQANVLLVEYRGYGNSDSVPPNEAGLKLDAEAALQYTHTKLLPMVDRNKIFLFGRSLGGSVAIHLAASPIAQQYPIAGVMVENTFLSISHMVDHLMPWLRYVKPLVLRLNWDSYSIISNVHVPILFLAGGKDELVPHHHMRLLHQAATKSSVLHVIPDGTHNESWVQGGAAYWDAMRSFIAGTVSSPAAPISSSSAEAAAATVEGDVKSSIPIMSSRFLDIAKDAAGLTNTQKADSDPKKKDL